jgi:hypothetical protein
MVSRLFTLQLSLSLTCALLLGGCAGMPTEQDSRHAVESSRELREKEMKLTWIGQRYQDLIQVLGAPRMIMDVPAYRPGRVSVAVYEGLDPASDCIDAFTVVHNDKPVIDDYFCR